VVPGGDRRSGACGENGVVPGFWDEVKGLEDWVGDKGIDGTG
jgi:hypothetical protein